MAILERHNEPVTLTIAGHQFTAKKLAAYELDSAVNDLTAKTIGPMEFLVRAFYLAIHPFYPDEKLETLKEFFTLSDMEELRTELKKIGIDDTKKKQAQEDDTNPLTPETSTGPTSLETQDGVLNTSGN